MDKECECCGVRPRPGVYFSADLCEGCHGQLRALRAVADAARATARALDGGNSCGMAPSPACGCPMCRARLALRAALARLEKP